MRWAAFFVVAFTVAGSASGGLAGAIICGGLMLAAVAWIVRLGG